MDVLPNASPFVDEELSDNAFVYASVQVMKVGVPREDTWHTDGGASLLHAGLTILGRRQLHVKLKHPTGCVNLELDQRPGSFYVGNVCVPWSIEWSMVRLRQAAGVMGRLKAKCKSWSCFGATCSARYEPAK